jgi:hypothetical protein
MPKFEKGSQEAKDYMAQLRAMRKTKQEVGSGLGASRPVQIGPATERQIAGQALREAILAALRDDNEVPVTQPRRRRTRSRSPNRQRRPIVASASVVPTDVTIVHREEIRPASRQSQQEGDAIARQVESGTGFQSAKERMAYVRSHRKPKAAI